MERLPSERLPRERLHILDGYGYIFRAYFALTEARGRQGVRLSTAAGMPTAALFVYARMLLQLHQKVRPERMVVVFDAPGPTFRDELDTGYKATRRETPEDLQVQMPFFRPLTEAFCWPVMSLPGVEADDVIATLTAQARARDWDVVIYTGDKDLMQLVGDQVAVIDPMRNIEYDAARVGAKFGVTPAQLGDYLALVGDSSDNVPGVAGVGQKRAAQLLNQHGSIDGILAHVAELKGSLQRAFSDPQQLERLALSRQLVALKSDVPLDRELDALRPLPWDGTRLRQLLEQFEFHALIRTLEAGSETEPRPGAAAGAGGAVVPPADRPGDRGGGRQGAAEAQTTLAGILTAAPAGAAGTAGQAGVTTLVTDAAGLTALASAARAAGRMALHAESDGERFDRCQLVGLAVAVPGRAPAYIPLAHRYLSVPVQLELGVVRELLGPVFADPQVAILCHDAKALIKLLERAGMTLAGLRCDTLLAAYLLDSSLSPAALEVHQVVRQATGAELASREAVLGKGKRALRFEALSVEEAARYTGAVAQGVLAAGQLLCDEVGRDPALEKLLDELELPLTVLLARIEQVGIRIDVPYLRALSEQIGARLAELEQRVWSLSGSEINIGSPRQLGMLLYEKLGLRPERLRKTKTGAYSTDAETLESLRGAHEVIEPILEHRELTKLKGTYIDALPPLVNPRTGRLHTDYRQAVAATGRLSSQEPNLQNIPIRTELGRQIRRAFVADEGRVLVSADYSQIELRIMAHLSADPVLRRAFAEKVDIHAQTAAEVFGMPLAQVGPAERRVAKAVNYGLIYGQSQFGLARALGIPQQEARHHIERYFERFATVRKFMDDVVVRARAVGAATTILGRRRPIPDLGTRNYQLRAAAERVAQNTPLQGSAADIMKLAMLRVQKVLDERQFRAQILLTVHDELVLEVDEAQAEEVAQSVAAAMASAYTLSVPLEVDVGIAKSWADAH
jgi:DNA polymerase-1